MIINRASPAYTVLIVFSEMTRIILIYSPNIRVISNDSVPRSLLGAAQGALWHLLTGSVDIGHSGQAQ